MRALGVRLGERRAGVVNLVDPDRFGPAQAFDAVAAEARVTRAELVGLVPESVLQSVPAHRWTELDLDADRTIEARLAARALGGRRCCGEPRPAGDGCGDAHARSCRPRCRTSRRWRARTRGSASRTTQPRQTSLASRVGRAALGEEQVGVDAEAVGVVLPAAVLRIERGLDALHRCGLPAPAAGRVQQCNRVITPM